MFQRLRRLLKLNRLRAADVAVITLLIIGLLVAVYDIVKWLRGTR